MFAKYSAYTVIDKSLIPMSRARVVLAIVSASSLLFNVAQTQFYTCMRAIYTNYNDKAYCT